MRFRLLILCTVVWLSIAGIGLKEISQYDAAPGDAEAAPASWPAHSAIRRDLCLNTLIMFAHPRCPCTQNSMTELERLLSRCQGLVSTQVWFLRPREAEAGWDDSRIWRRARAIPGVLSFADEDGVESRRFGARTSGHVVLYDVAGRCLFSGGLTAARGHPGETPAPDAIVALLTNGKANLSHSAVFGCPLFEPNTTAAMEILPQRE